MFKQGRQMKVIDISKSEILIEKLEELHQQKKSYIFRGLPSDSFTLLPKSFRPDIIKKALQNFPACTCYHTWSTSKEVKQVVSSYLNEAHMSSLWVQRICELTFYIMQYNYFLAKYVQQNQVRFDRATINIYQLHTANFWIKEKTFIEMFRYGLNLSIGRITLDGKILNYTVINEELAGYDESLPQHYDTPTAALDWTYNPYIAIYFALQNIPKNTDHFLICAYKEINSDKNNPIGIELGHPQCSNFRIIRQEGLFTRIRNACLYYFHNGMWPDIEAYSTFSQGNFELVKYKVPVSQAEYLSCILKKKGLTKEYLLPENII